MEAIYKTLSTRPLLLFITVALCLLLAWAILQRILKLALVVLLALTAYGAWMVHSGQPLPKNTDELVRQGKETMVRIREDGKGMVNTEHWKEVLDDRGK